MRKPNSDQSLPMSFPVYSSMFKCTEKQFKSFLFQISIHPSFIKDYNDVGHQDYVERGAHLSLSDYGLEYDYDQHDFEYDLGSFDYY